MNKQKNIKFAAMIPHPPILLPHVGSPEDHAKLKKTLKSLEELKKSFDESNIDEIIISSPHQDWGFNVPLYFLTENFSGNTTPYLTNTHSPKEHYQLGKNSAAELEEGKNYALIASGDLSHALKEEGPYSYHPDGPKFDEELVKNLEQKKINELLNLNDKYPEAAECGLRSLAFTLGLIEGSSIELNPKILSYEGPFGVGYLVAKLV